jgi:hypothetical protein
VSLRPLVTAGLLVLALAGCEKPTPGVTVAAGSSSVHIESTTYCHDGQSAEQANCVEHLDRLGIIKVKRGEQVMVDVDKDIAEDGWVLVDSDANARSDIQDEHYFAFTPDFRNGPVVRLEIRSLDEPADNAQVTGVWKFQLIQR